jgi:hypothetical protein
MKIETKIVSWELSSCSTHKLTGKIQAILKNWSNETISHVTVQSKIFFYTIQNHNYKPRTVIVVTGLFSRAVYK